MTRLWRVLILALVAAAVVAAFSLKGDGGKPPADNAEVQTSAPSADKAPEMAVDGPGEKTPAAKDDQVGKVEPEKAPVKAEKPAEQPEKKPEKVAPKPKRLPKIIDVGADRCIPCKMMVPVLDELRAEYKGRLEVVLVNISTDPDAAKTYRVSTIPTQILYGTDGKEIARHFGFFAKEDIVATFEKHGIKL